MSEPSNSIFNQKTLDKMYSADNLNRALRISNPGFWIILAACIVFLAGFIIWGFFGKVVAAVSVNGVCMDGQIHCFLTDKEASEVDVGDEAQADKTKTTVLSISEQPLSKSEGREILQSDYLVDKLFLEKWAYHVILDGNGLNLRDRQTVDVRIIIRELAPVMLVTGGAE